jgi:hypothetical protein
LADVNNEAVTIKIPRKVKDTLREIALKHNRSLSAQIAEILTAHTSKPPGKTGGRRHG